MSRTHHLHQPNWRLIDSHHDRAIPATWSDWLADQGSLTQRLINACTGAFGVKLLSLRTARPSADESHHLALPSGRWALIREVALYDGDTPLVFARSILPLTTLTGRLRSLRQLDNRPLGALLFADRTMRRGPIEVARIPGQQLPANLAPADGPFWGRRSVFYLDDKPLLVCEIFLPGFEELVKP